MPDTYDTMSPREIDGRVHTLISPHSQRAQGSSEWAEPYFNAGSDEHPRYEPVPHYTEDAALLPSIVEAMNGKGWTFARLFQDDSKSFGAEWHEGYLTSYDRVAIEWKQPSLMLAVCLAALRALDQTTDA